MAKLVGKDICFIPNLGLDMSKISQDMGFESQILNLDISFLSESEND